MFSDITERNNQKQLSLSKMKNQPKIQHKTVVLSALHLYYKQNELSLQVYCLSGDCLQWLNQHTDFLQVNVRWRVVSFAAIVWACHAMGSNWWGREHIA